MMKYLYIAAALFLFAIPSASFAASISLSPSSGAYAVGDTITVKVLVSSPGASVNAVSGKLLTSTDIFTLQSVSKSSSVLNFWPTEPSVSSGTGTVDFGGVTISGFQGTAGTVVTLTLLATHAGTGTLTFQNGQVLANDGNGTDITSGLSGASFTIHDASQAPAPRSNTATPRQVSARTKASVITHPASPAAVEPPVVANASMEQAPSLHVSNLLTQPGVPLALALMIAFLLGMFCARSFINEARDRHTVGDALDDVDVAVHQAFLNLREHIRTSLEDLEKESTHRALTAAEMRFVKKMKKTIKDTEKVIEENVHEART